MDDARAWVSFRLPNDASDDLVAGALDMLVPHRIGGVEVVAVGESDTVYRVEVQNT